MTDLGTVRNLIISGVFTNDDLNSIADAIKFARSQLAKQNARNFWSGDTVKFTSARNGVTYTGTVEKVKVKFALVRTNAARFNVPLSMLEAV
jgi:hypothetical protein